MWAGRALRAAGDVAARSVSKAADRGPRLAATFARALVGATATVVVVTSLVFVALRVLPGDPVALALGEQSSLAERAALRHALLLDRPLLSQYAALGQRLVHGRVGASIRHPELDAATMVARALPSTAALASLSVAIGTVAGLAMGLAAIAGQTTATRSLGRMGLTAASTTPLLALVPVATWVFAVRLHWVPLPADPDAGFVGLLYASTLLAIPLSAAVGRVARASLVDAAESDFLRVARAKGRGRVGVWLAHALPTCAGPIVTVIAAQLGALLGGAVVLERLLDRRGVGSVLADAVASRDLPVIEACVLASTALFVVVQTAGTTLHALVDPRARRR